MADHEIPDALRDELRSAWQRYVDLLAPLRPDLHRYCRRLTGSLWDAEDLAQDTLLRAFATLGSVHHRIENPRAYLLRVATHAWIDTLRRRHGEVAALAERVPAEAGEADAEPGAVRDAGTALIRRLAPQERAAVVLKDVFELSLREIAAVLGRIPPELDRRQELLPETSPRPRPPASRRGEGVDSPARGSQRRADPEEGAEGAEPPARPPSHGHENAVLRAAQMAVAGSSREEIERALASELAISDPGPIVDELLGPRG